MTPELSNVLAALAQKLGTSAEHLWPLLVARARLDAAMGITFSAVIGITSVVVIILSAKAYKREREWSDVNPGWALSGIIACVLVVVCLGCIGDGITNLVYPEVAALKTIIGK